jgi:hypothetical protein
MNADVLKWPIPLRLFSVDLRKQVFAGDKLTLVPRPLGAFLLRLDRAP